MQLMGEFKKKIGDTVIQIYNILQTCMIWGDVVGRILEGNWRPKVIYLLTNE